MSGGIKISKVSASFLMLLLIYSLCSCSAISSLFPTPTPTSTVTPTPTSTPTPIYTITPISFPGLDSETPQPVPKATLITERIYPTPISVPTFVIIRITVTPGPLCVGNCSYITINNATGSNMTINLSGPISIKGRVIPTGATTIAVKPGSYSLSVTASCGSTLDTFNLGPGDSQSVRYWCS